VPPGDVVPNPVGGKEKPVSPVIDGDSVLDGLLLLLEDGGGELGAGGDVVLGEGRRQRGRRADGLKAKQF
jgi:hypothetical protein